MNMQWLEKVKSIFEGENPGIKVEFEWIKWDELDLKSLRDYRAGISHDVIYSSPQYYGFHELAKDLFDISNFTLHSGQRNALMTLPGALFGGRHFLGVFPWVFILEP